MKSSNGYDLVLREVQRDAQLEMGSLAAGCRSPQLSSQTALIAVGQGFDQLVSVITTGAITAPF